MRHETLAGLALLFSVSVLQGQTVIQPYATQQDIKVIPAAPTANYQYSLQAYTDCGLTATALSPPPGPTSADLGVQTVHLLHPLRAGNTVCVIESYVYQGNPPVPVPGPDPVVSPLVITLPSPPSDQFDTTAPIFAAIAGLEIAGASSTDTSAVFHASAVFDMPLSKTDAGLAETKYWIGGGIRIAGIAQPTSLTGKLGSLDSTGSYLATAVTATPDKIVQSAEVNANFSYQIFGWRTSNSSFDNGTAPAGGGSGEKTVVSFSAIANIGAITPVSVDQVQPPVYTVTSQLYGLYGPGTSGHQLPSACDPSANPPTACYLSFVPYDRSRFYRHYEAGFRVKTYGRDFSDKQYRFPAITDLTVGQNEYVTGGQARHFVLHLGGWVPVPHADGVYLFGSMDTVLTGNSGGPQLVLVPAPTTAMLTYTSPSVYQVSVSQPNRDRYMLGFGVDLYHLLQKSLSGK